MKPKSLQRLLLLYPVVTWVGVAADSPNPVAIGRGGSDGFLATGAKGTIHVIVGGKYRYGATPADLSSAETITDIAPVCGVRLAIDSADQPHVVFTNGMTDRARRSYYTARIRGRWLPAEKFADAEDFPDRTRAYVPDVAADESGSVLVCFWVSRPNAKRAEFDNPSFYYRWRSPSGRWGAPQSLPAHWSSAPKVEYATGRGFYLLWQYRGTDWRIAGPVRSGAEFSFAQSVSCGSGALTAKLTTVQNEGADFSVLADGTCVVAGNIREKFEGPVGVWATSGTVSALSASVYLGGFDGTVRGNESGIHPVTTTDAETGDDYVVMMDPRSKTARYGVRRRGGEWERIYQPLLPGQSTPQGTLRQGPSIADVPGPGVLALARDGQERWFLQRLSAR